MNAGTLAVVRPLPVPLDDDERPVACDLLSTLALISQARRQLTEARTVPDAVRIIEAAGLAEDAARRTARLAEAQRLASEVVEAATQAANDAATVRIETQVKAGLPVQALQENGTLAQQGRPGKRSGGRTFSEAGIEKRDAHLWRRVAPELRRLAEVARKAGRR